MRAAHGVCGLPVGRMAKFIPAVILRENDFLCECDQLLESMRGIKPYSRRLEWVCDMPARNLHRDGFPPQSDDSFANSNFALREAVQFRYDDSVICLPINSTQQRGILAISMPGLEEPSPESIGASNTLRCPESAAPHVSIHGNVIWAIKVPSQVRSGTSA